MNNDEAFSKLLKYCSYQERCHEEVRAKLISLKVYGNDLDNIITRLIEHNFLNEERFAKTYAGSKFRQMQWGKTKITYQLKFKKISDYCIREAMKEIDDASYMKTLRQLLEKRKLQIKDDRNWLHKTAQHLIGKGYEPDLVWRELKAEE
jgi:regulatory protein